MERVSFTAPVSFRDLRVVLSRTAVAIEPGNHQLTYATQAGEIRTIRWLTASDAHTRAKLLKARGYRNVAVSRAV